MEEMRKTKMSAGRLHDLVETLLPLSGRIPREDLKEEFGKYYDSESIGALIWALLTRGMKFKETN